MTPLPAFGIKHDGFVGDLIGTYETREGKRGAVLQQHGTRVVHVYGTRWLIPLNDEAALVNFDGFARSVARLDQEPERAEAELAAIIAQEPVARVKPLKWVSPSSGRDTLAKAETIVGVYRIWTHHEADGFWFGILQQLDEHTEFIGTSKAEVQHHVKCDYERRVRSALEAASPLAIDAERMRDALEAAAFWHDAQDESISKQPNANGGYNGWMRSVHQEQAALLRSALIPAPADGRAP